MIKKADIVLAFLLIVLGIVGSYAFSFGDETGQTVSISVNGKEYGSYSLLENRTVTIHKSGHLNKVTIKDGQVSMTFSDCANQTCIHQGHISRTSESIVCLPNKVIIEIDGGNREYDSISR